MLHVISFLPWCAHARTHLPAGVFGVVYDGYLSNAEDDPEGTNPVIIKTVKGMYNYTGAVVGLAGACGGIEYVWRGKNLVTVCEGRDTFLLRAEYR